MVAARHERSISPLDASAKRLLGDRRLILAANRGPVSFSALADGTLRPRRGSGGVVTALSQVSDIESLLEQDRSARAAAHALIAEWS